MTIERATTGERRIRVAVEPHGRTQGRYPDEPLVPRDAARTAARHGLGDELIAAGLRSGGRSRPPADAVRSRVRRGRRGRRRRDVRAGWAPADRHADRAGDPAAGQRHEHPADAGPAARPGRGGARSSPTATCARSTSGRSATASSTRPARSACMPPRRESCPWSTRATTGRSSGPSWQRSAIDPPRCASSWTATATIVGEGGRRRGRQWARSWAPGLAVAPEALLDDGLFDVRVFLHYTKAELLRYVDEHRPRSPPAGAALAHRAGEPGPHHERTTAPGACRRRGPGNDPGRLRDPTEGPHGRRPGPISVTERVGTARAALPHPRPRRRGDPLGAGVRQGPTQRPGAAATAPRPDSHR